MDGDSSMKANALHRVRRDDRAESGVGTMIIFIALVLVAAVAAAVLVGTSGMLQERATSTGNSATKDVSSNLKLLRVEGYKDGASGNIDTMNFTFELAAGSLGVGWEKLVAVYNDGDSVTNYAYDSTNDDPTVDSDYASIATNKFGLYWVRNVDGDTVSSSVPYMEAGDLVTVYLATPNDLAPRDEVTVEFLPESGSPAVVDIRAPSSYSDVYVTLR